MTPKDKDHITKKVVSSTGSSAKGWTVKMNTLGSHQEPLVRGIKEHLKAPSPMYDHHTITGHETSIDNFSIVGREDQNLIRAIKEAIYMRVNSPSLNKNIGKYHLPHIWDEVLLNSSELKLK